MVAEVTAPCPGCGAEFAPFDGPVHEYMGCSTGCWRAFGEVLAREYGDRDLFAVHRLTVDAYAVQHPGDDSRQAIQSVGVHLVRLCLFVERGLSAEDANAAMLRVGEAKASMFKLPRPQSIGAMTVADVLATESKEAHARTVRQWAGSAWQAWEASHEIIRRWAGST